MTPSATARLALSLLTEPGDPRLVQLRSAGLADEDLLDGLRSGRGVAGQRLAPAWTERLDRIDALVDRARSDADAAGLRWVVPGDKDWPGRLDDLDHLDALHGATGAPLGLWMRGEGRLARLAQLSLAVVGARSCTSYGAQCASELAADVSDAGVTVVSGAAFGIDASGHRGALAVGRPTVAVLASGADNDSPRAHAALLRRIVDGGGLVVSEQPPGQIPVRSRFLSRNRLIAALATGTVVVEAARRSGSLNTLHWADRLGRPTMVVPGPVTSAQSGGTHRAVRDGKAVLVTDHRDVLEELGVGVDSADDPAQTGEAEAVRAVIDALAWDRALTVRDVTAHVDRTAAEVRTVLDALARRGIAARVGDRYVLAARADGA